MRPSHSPNFKITDDLTPIARLTLGLMGLDEIHLRVLAISSEDPVEKRNAQTGVHLATDQAMIILTQSSLEADTEPQTLGTGSESMTSSSLSARLKNDQVLLLGNVVCQPTHRCWIYPDVLTSDYQRKSANLLRQRCNCPFSFRIECLNNRQCAIARRWRRSHRNFYRRHRYVT